MTTIGKYLREKSSFVVIFILAGDLVGIVCCLGAFNREEDVVFGYVHFINTWKSDDICGKFTEMGVIWLFLPQGGCLHADCEKISRSTGVVLLSGQRP